MKINDSFQNLNFPKNNFNVRTFVFASQKGARNFFFVSKKRARKPARSSLEGLKPASPRTALLHLADCSNRAWRDCRAAQMMARCQKI